MTDRPDRGGYSAASLSAHPVDEIDPLVIVVPYRSGRHSAKLLPPILLVLLGTAFLAYRARISDWRGASALFESRPKPVTVPPLARTIEPPPTVRKPEPPETREAKRPDGARGHETTAKDAVAKADVDPLEDIKREAEKTRDRVAELQKLKEREARKLDETADERRRAARIDRRPGPGFRAGRVPAEQFDRMLRAQGEQVRRQMDLIARLQRRQMEQMAAMRRDFLNERGPMLLPPPSLPPFPLDPGRVPRLPDDGFARFRGFPGPDGAQGFRFQFRAGGDPRSEDAALPPPPPRPRRFD